MINKLENIKAVLEDKEFVAHICDLVDPRDVQKAFAEKGVELSLEEISTIALTSAALEQGEELDADLLEKVSGGAVVEAIIVICGLIGLGGKAMEAINKERTRNGKNPIW